MKKYFLGLLAFMFVSAITLSATSCSKSDTEEPGDNGGNGSNISSRIVGTWYCGESADDFDMMYVFNADGTGKGYEGYKDTWDIVYRYEESTGILTIIETGDGDIDYYLVEFINNDTVVTYEIHDDGVDRENPEVFKRVK